MTSGRTPCVLAIDIGSSSTRAMLYDAGAQALPEALAQRTNRAITSAEGGAVFDAEELLAGIVEVIDQILHSAGPAGYEIDAVAVDSLVGNVLGVDHEGRAVTPVFTYADTRNAADAQALRKELGPAGVAAAHERTGTVIHTSYLPARFRWLHRAHPEWFGAAVRWVSIGEYLAHRLFGRWMVSYSVAAWTGMLNRRSLTWDAEWLGCLPVGEEQLSPLGDLNQPFRGLRPEWAARWQALKEIPWLPAVGDGAAANIGSGCDAPERIALTIGSTGAMRVVVNPDDVTTMPGGLWLYRVDARRGLLGGATTEGGNFHGWLRETLLLPAGDELEQALNARPPDGHGLTVLPFVAGERAPGWREDARAVFAGIGLHTTAVDLVQASLEAIAYRFALIYGRIAPHLHTAGEPAIIASGGGLLSSPAWMQIVADVLGRPLLTLTEREATSRGLALLALEQLGVIDRPSALPPATGVTYFPDPARHDVYAAAVARQQTLYSALLE